MKFVQSAVEIRKGSGVGDRTTCGLQSDGAHGGQTGPTTLLKGGRRLCCG